MTLALDTPRRAGRWTVAALCEHRVWSHAHGGALAVAGHKVPVAILVCDGTTVRACDLAGHRLDPDRLETRCPGLLESLREAAFGA